MCLSAIVVRYLSVGYVYVYMYSHPATRRVYKTCRGPWHPWHHRLLASWLLVNNPQEPQLTKNKKGKIAREKGKIDRYSLVGFVFTLFFCAFVQLYSP